MNYIGLCSNVRRDSAGEGRWQEMMRCRSAIEEHTAVALLCPEFTDEFADVFLAATNGQYDELCAQDPSAGWFVSVWGTGVCLFYQNAGFEYIWIG